MSIYKRFCQETVGENGTLTDISLHYPENFNFAYDVVDAIAAETPEKRAMVWCNAENEERFFTFSDIKEQSDRMANAFRAAGLKQGDRVMLVLKRHYEYWFAVLALHKLGVTAIPATHMLTVSDYVYRLRMAKVNAIVCTPYGDTAEKLRSAVEEAEADSILWTVRKNIKGFRNLTEEAAAAPSSLERISTKVTDPMLLYFTPAPPAIPRVSSTTFPIPWPTLSQRNTGSRPRTMASTSP